MKNAFDDQTSGCIHLMILDDDVRTETLIMMINNDDV